MIKELAEKWKNRETKKSLREENLKLQGQIEALAKIPQPSIHIIDREVKVLRASMTVDSRDPRDAESVKREIAYILAKELPPFVEWDIGNQNHMERELIGSIYLSIKK